MAATVGRKVVRYTLPPDSPAWAGSKPLKPDQLLAVPDNPTCAFAPHQPGCGLTAFCTGDGVVHVGPAAGEPAVRLRAADSFGTDAAAVGFDVGCTTCVVGAADGSLAFYTVGEQLQELAQHGGGEGQVAAGGFQEAARYLQ